MNITLNFIDRKVVTRFSAYKFHSAETNQELGIRFMQLIFGTLVAIMGYSTLMIKAAYGCSFSPIYLFYCGGFLLSALDIHEYVRRWPLRPAILGHHLMVMFIALAYLDYGLLPPGNTLDVPNSLILIVSNIGLMWTLDFFHVVFRLSMNLPTIERMRQFYLYGSLVKIMTFGLMIYSGIEAILLGSYVGSLPSILLSIAYGYNTYKSIGFVYMFDCENYFLKHQVIWQQSMKYEKVDYDEENHQDEKNKNDHEEGQVASNLRQSSRLRLSVSSLRRMSSIISGLSGSTRRSSIVKISNAFNIDLVEGNAEVMEGLRGDLATEQNIMED